MPEESDRDGDPDASCNWS